MDRGYAGFALLHKIVARQSRYLCRLRDNSTWETIEERSRNNDAQLGEIISDEFDRFSPGSGGSCPDHMICVTVQYSEVAEAYPAIKEYLQPDTRSTDDIIMSCLMNSKFKLPNDLLSFR